MQLAKGGFRLADTLRKLYNGVPLLGNEEADNKNEENDGDDWFLN